MRLKIIRLIIVVLFMVIAGDLIYIQGLRGQYYYNLSVNNRIRVVPLTGSRGRIIDRNGVVLADNRLSFDVTVIPQEVRDKEQLFFYLSNILKVNRETLLQRFAQKKEAPFAPVVIAQDVDKRVAMILEENKYRLPGLYIQETFQRQYPFREVGAHVLGYVGNINRDMMERLKDYGYSFQSIVGKNGVEEVYDSYLIGKEGGQQIEVNSRGRQVNLLGIREPRNGQNIQITIDQRIQAIAASALGDAVGTVIIMNLDTGEILGMVNSPSYDPNIFVDSRLKKQVGQVTIDKASPLLNRAIQGLYPPGSVFKAVVSLAALASQKISRHTPFRCDGAYYLGKHRFGCPHVHGSQNLIEAISHSCNVYFFNVGNILGPDFLSKYAKMLGLGSVTEIDLPYEEKGVVPGRTQRKLKQNRGWYKGDTLNFSIGQGDLLVTPLQLVRMIAIIARNGQEVQPHMIMKIGEKEVVSFATIRQVALKEDHFAAVQEGFRSVVGDLSGTARMLNMEDIVVAGKTGTAQSAGHRDHHAWFVGYVPEGKLRIAFCVFLEYGGSSFHAVGLARKILRQMRDDQIL
jgi:penicillin-binding protein 2